MLLTSMVLEQVIWQASTNPLDAVNCTAAHCYLRTSWRRSLHREPFRSIQDVLAAAMSEVELEDFEHEGFSLDLDAMYPMRAILGFSLSKCVLPRILSSSLCIVLKLRNCYHALRVLAKNNPANRKAMNEAGSRS